MTNPITLLAAAAMLSAVTAPASALTLTLRGDSLLRAVVETNGTSLSSTGDSTPDFEPFSERTFASFQNEVPTTASRAGASASIMIDAAEGSIRGIATGSNPSPGATGSEAAFFGSFDLLFDITGDAPVALETGWLRYRADGTLFISNSDFGQSGGEAYLAVRSRRLGAEAGFVGDIASLIIENNSLVGFRNEPSIVRPSFQESFFDFSQDNGSFAYEIMLSVPGHTLVPGEQLLIQLGFVGRASNGISDGLSTALLGMTLPAGVTVDTSILGPDAPAWLGRDLSGPVQPIPVPPALLLALTGFGLLGAVRARRRAR